MTWRKTPYCFYCHCDLRAYDEEQRRIQRAVAAQAARQAKLKLAGFFFLVGVALFFAGQQLHGVFDYSWFISLLGIASALAAVKGAK